MWPSSEQELRAVQAALAVAEPAPWTGAADAIGGCAVRFPRGGGGAGAASGRAWAAAAVLRGGRVDGEAVREGRAAAPYRPGLLALREGPLLEAAVRALPARPDVVLVDATGRDHPRRAGLALHLGAVLDLPTVGVTHRPLLARGDWPAETRRGATAPLELGGDRVGAWVRTRAGARPVAVHAGWRVTVDDAVAIVLAAGGRHRTPEPLRAARRLARLARVRGG